MAMVYSENNIETKTFKLLNRIVLMIYSIRKRKEKVNTSPVFLDTPAHMHTQAHTKT